MPFAYRSMQDVSTHPNNIFQTMRTSALLFASLFRALVYILRLQILDPANSVENSKSRKKKKRCVASESAALDLALARLIRQSR